MKICQYCSIEYKFYPSRNRKYCSRRCSSDAKIHSVFQKIENGFTSFGNELTNRRNFKKYLIHVHGEKCMECGWDKRNPITNKVPIELEHIDGNSENNKIENLKLLCPNCHSLTPTYKALNVGKGRISR
jgi:hypothetical protein